MLALAGAATAQDDRLAGVCDTAARSIPELANLLPLGASRRDRIATVVLRSESFAVTKIACTFDSTDRVPPLLLDMVVTGPNGIAAPVAPRVMIEVNAALALGG